MTPPATGGAALAGLRVVSIAVNLPGPVAAARLVGLGASVVKVEPPSGDPLRLVAPAYYDELVAGQDVRTLDLKDDAGRARLDELLSVADVFVTSNRAAALERLGLDWPELHGRHPRLSQVAIVGSPAPDDDVPGHDLLYQAAVGTLTPPAMPTVLLADLAGAERAVTEALAAVLARASTGVGRFCEVSLAVAAQVMGGPLRHGLTTPGGPLGGGLAAYAIYAAADGHVALAGLEPHFHARLLTLLDVPDSRLELERVFRTRPARAWQEWAREHDLPLAAVVAPREDRAGGEETARTARGTMEP